MSDNELKCETNEIDHTTAPPGLSQQRYESLVQSIDGIVWEADAKTFKFTFVNNQAEKILGYSVDQWLTEPDFWVRHLHPIDRAWVVDFCIEATRKRKDHQFEYRMIAADGRMVWLRDIVTVETDDDGNAVLRGVMFDITERKRADENILREKQLTDAILDSLPGAFFMFNEKRERVRWNKYLEEATGYSSDEIAEMPLFHNVAEEHRPQLRQAVEEIFEKGHGTTEADLVLKDGTRRPYFLKGRRVTIGDRICLIGVGIDISERKAAEDALRRSEELFRAIVEDQTEMIVRWKPDGTRTFVNQAYCNVFGGKPEDFIGTSFYPLIAEKYREGIREKIRSLTSENPLATEIHESISTTGEVRWQKWTDRGIFDDDGRLVELQSTGRDITERKRVEDELREREKELNEAQRLAKVGSWTWDVGTDAITWSDEIYRRRNVDATFAPPPLSEHKKFYTAESWERLNAALQDALQTGKSQELELELVRSGDERAWTVTRSEPIRDADGRVVKLRGTTQDITEAKLAEEKLRLSEERFAKAFNASPQPISIYRHKDGALLEVNERWITIYGFTREEAIEHTSLERGQVKADDRTKLRSLLEEKHSIRDYEIDLRTKKGGIRHVSISAEQIVINNELCDIFLHRDITDQKRAEDENLKLIHDLGERVKEVTALHQTARVLQEGLKTIPELLNEIVKLIPSAWQYPDITAACISFGEFAVKSSNFTKTRWSQSAKFTVAGIQGVIEVVYLEKRPKQDIGPFLTEEKNLIDSLAEMIRSAINRKYTQEELGKSEERYRELVENALDIIFTHDMEGYFTSINKAGEQILGYTREEARKMKFSQILAPEYVEKAFQIMAGNLAGEEATVDDLEVIAKDGRRVAVEVNSRAILNNGIPVGIQGIARDVTERRQLEEILRHSQKLEGIGQLAGGIAHDFNNILTAINGYSDLTLRKLDKDDPVRTNVEEIKKAAERSTQLINQLMAFSRKQVMQPKILDLGLVVSGIEQMLRPLIGARIDLRTVCAPELGKVRADPIQMEQVILNLVVNARDAMPDGGTIVIKAENVYLDKEFGERQVLAKQGQYVLMEVIDSGVGMEEETIKHIFEPFYTTKELGKGTGLGLATVYGIVKQSGGYIWADSEPGHGTTFRVYLPLVDNS